MSNLCYMAMADVKAGIRLKQDRHKEMFSNDENRKSREDAAWEVAY